MNSHLTKLSVLHKIVNPDGAEERREKTCFQTCLPRFSEGKLSSARVRASLRSHSLCLLLCSSMCIIIMQRLIERRRCDVKPNKRQMKHSHSPLFLFKQKVKMWDEIDGVWIESEK